MYKKIILYINFLIKTKEYCQNSYKYKDHYSVTNRILLGMYVKYLAMFLFHLFWLQIQMDSYKFIFVRSLIGTVGYILNYYLHTVIVPYIVAS